MNEVITFVCMNRHNIGAKKGSVLFSIAEKPYHLLAFAAIILILLSWVPFEKTTDLHLHDSYLVFDYAFMLRAIAMLMLLFWLLYNYTRYFLFSKQLIWVHIILSMTILICVIFCIIRINHVHRPDINTDNGWALKVHSKTRLLIPVLIVFFLLAQLVYIINLLLGLIKKMN